LIRPSDTYEDEESMSILDFNKERYFHVKHYRIRRTDQGLFYLNKKKVFSSLQDLVNYYQSKS
jgi:fyn-related kinase